jgi:NHL repeat
MGTRGVFRLGLSMALLSIALAAPAQATVGDELVSIGRYGSEAGELKFGGEVIGELGTSNGGGIAGDPTTGHVFVSDLGNSRVSEFTAFGEFVKAWGWGVADGATAALQTCTTACFAGQQGSGVGQLKVPNGVALAPNGDLYVFERENHRIQVFDPNGKFVLMFGGGVNVTDGTDVCTAADVTAGDVCGAGSAGGGPSEFFQPDFTNSSSTGSDYIDFGPDGLLYVGDKDRIQKFELDGDFVGQLPLPKSGTPGSLTVDPVSGDVYFAFSNPPDAYRLDKTTGAVVYKLPTTALEGMAPNPAGTLFVADDPDPVFNKFPQQNPLLREIDGTGQIIESCCPSTSKEGESVFLPALGTNVVTFAGGVDLYVAHSNASQAIAFIEARGPGPDKWDPPPEPPDIDAQFASELEKTTATLNAQINPNFWDDTTYFVEWGTAPCPGVGCTKTPETELGAGVVKVPVTTGGVELNGLTPGTTYHYRFVSQSGGGGPTLGPDQTFTTSSPVVHPPPCPANEAFRIGLSASLWECRAYELVSPVDKLGGDIIVVGNINGTPSRLDQATPEGEKVTYSSYRSFGDAQSAPYSTQYIASREAGKEWATHAISPPREGRIFTGPRGLDSQFKAFSEDLSFGWMVFDTSPVLATGGVPDYPNLYRRDNTSEAYQAMSTAKPTPTGAGDFNFEVQGASADSTHTVFRANGKITATASNQEINQVYENVNGALRLVSVKPAGGPITVETSVGSWLVGYTNGREANVKHAVSEDGEKIYFTEVGGTGRLYVRTNGTATTQVSSGAATYWDATPDGAEALYVEAGKLRLFNLASKASSTLVEEGVGGVMGASEDLNRIYFTSSADLAGEAEAGQPNLYLFEEGQPLAFVVTLSGVDASSLVPAPISLSSRLRTARVSPDGQVAIFASRGALTGEDNLDQASGEPDAEVFRYDATSEELACISCLGNGQRAKGRQLRFDNTLVNYYYASLIPGWEFLHATRALSEDGDRAYFNSLNPLVPQDTNGMQDAYEWEAPGKGDCEPTSPNYRPASAGCVSLVSTGTSPKDSEFVDASSDGRDVFFLTAQSLVAQDPGQVDLYDAREGGGLPTPPVPGPGCEGSGEGCLPAQAPAPPAPAGGASLGPSAGNVKPPKKCPKGKVRRKGKCVKKHHKKHKAAKHRKASR